MFGDSRYNQQILEPERYQQALTIVNDHVSGRERSGGPKKQYMVSAVMRALKQGLDEQTVLRVIAIWQKWCCYPGPYRRTCPRSSTRPLRRSPECSLKRLSAGYDAV